MIISASIKAPAGGTGGGPAGLPGSGGAGRGLIPTGGPGIIFSDWLFRSLSGRANFAPDWSKSRRTPVRVEIAIDANISKNALWNCIVRKFAPTNFLFVCDAFNIEKLLLE